MQRAQSSRPGGQTEEQQREASSLSGSRGRAEDDRVRIRVSGRRVDNKSQSNADDSAQENQSGKKKVCFYSFTLQCTCKHADRVDFYLLLSN